MRWCHAFLVVVMAAAGCGELPSDEIEQRTDAVTAIDLARRWAPVHYQDVNKKTGTGLFGKSDYMTKFDYDGDMIGDNNWDNLSSASSIEAVMYYSVTESTSHYFIYYVAYHPRDWAAGFGPTEHENDGEGCLLLVRKGGLFGTLEAVTTAFHDGWNAYRAQSYVGGGPFRPGTPPLIQFEGVDSVSHPRTYQEPEGHGFIACTSAVNCVRSDDDMIKYVPGPGSGAGAVHPFPIPDRTRFTLSYRLEDMATKILPRRYDRPTFVNHQEMAGDSSGDCGQGFSVCQNNAARGIWAHDQGDLPDFNRLAGEDPATFMNDLFSFGGQTPPSADYLSRPFLHSICQQGRHMKGSANSCVQTVCAVDEFCCNVAWDSQCVDEVTRHCGLSCQGCRSPAPEPNICAVQPGPIGSGCASECARTICAPGNDPFCCTNQWDSQCVAEVTSICGLGGPHCP